MSFSNRRINRTLLSVLIGVGLAASGCATSSETNEATAVQAGRASSGNDAAAEQADATEADDSAVADAGAESAADENGADEVIEVDEAPEELASVDSSDPLSDIVSCTYIDSETIEIEAVNNSANSSSYGLTVAYFDAAGQRISDDSQFIDHLRPAERTIERLYVWDDLEASSCEVLAVDRWEDQVNEAAQADVPSCEITGSDAFGDIEAYLEVTNNGDDTGDYSITVGFFDGDGVRRGTGSSFVEVVRPGESAPSDVFTVVEDNGYTCEIVAVSRSAS